MLWKVQASSGVIFKNWEGTSKSGVANLCDIRLALICKVRVTLAHSEKKSVPIHEHIFFELPFISFPRKKSGVKGTISSQYEKQNLRCPFARAELVGQCLSCPSKNPFRTGDRSHTRRFFLTETIQCRTSIHLSHSHFFKNACFIRRRCSLVLLWWKNEFFSVRINPCTGRRRHHAIGLLQPEN